jgi:N-acetylglutamate synthase-like GNAT family acetyltransferase
MNFNPVLHRLNDITNRDIKTEVYLKEKKARDLHRAGIVSQKKGTKTRATVSLDGDVIGIAEYVQFYADSVATIHSIDVKKEWQDKNIGTALTEGIIQSVRNSADKIYRYPINKKSLHIASEKQEFEPAEQDILEGWYVKEI